MIWYFSERSKVFVTSRYPGLAFLDSLSSPWNVGSCSRASYCSVRSLGLSLSNRCRTTRLCSESHDRDDAAQPNGTGSGPLGRWLPAARHAMLSPRQRIPRRASQAQAWVGQLAPDVRFGPREDVPVMMEGLGFSRWPGSCLLYSIRAGCIPSRSHAILCASGRPRNQSRGCKTGNGGKADHE